MKVYVVHGIANEDDNPYLCLNSEHGVWSTLNGARNELQTIKAELLNDYGDFIELKQETKDSLLFKYSGGTYSEYKIVECEVNK